MASVSALALLVGCSDGSEEGGGETGSNGAVAMSYPTLDVQIWQDTLDVMRPIVEEAGYTLLTSDPQNDVQAQIADWQGWIARGDVKAIMAWPAQADAVVPVSAELGEAGIPLVGYANTWAGVLATANLDNEADGYNIGVAAAEQIIEMHGSDTAIDVALFTDRSSDMMRERSDGLVAAIEERLPSAVIHELTALTRDDAYATTNAHLTAHPETRSWISTSSDWTLGMYQAILDTGVSPDDEEWMLATLDAVDEVLDVFLLPDSILRIAYILPAEELGRANAALLLAAAEGEELEDSWLESVPVTRDNAESFYVG